MKHVHLNYRKELYQNVTCFKCVLVNMEMPRSIQNKLEL
jgi:hypothetical protein